MGTASYTKTTVSNFRTTIRARNYTTMPVTLLTGQNLVLGDVVGIVTASGKAIKSLPGASDGSEVPVGILPIAADATAADLPVEVIASGEVDFNSLATTTWTEANLRLALQDRGIVLYNSSEDSSEGVV